MNELLSSYLKGPKETSVLLSGPRGVPLKEEGLMAVAELLDTEVPRLESHPDFLSFQGSEPLTVDDAMKLVAFTGLLPSKASRRVVFVECFERFNEAAQNKLLKVIEEGAVLVVATSYDTEHILPTIKSRMVNVKYQPMAFEKFKVSSGAADEETAEAMYFAYGGVLPKEPDPKLVSYFTGAGKAVAGRDGKALLSVLHLAKEKDEENFFLTEKAHVASLYAYLLEVAEKTFGEEVERSLSAAKVLSDHRCQTAGYSKDDFFLAMIRLGELLK